MGKKVCTVTTVEERGIPKRAVVEAHSLLEAAARGLEKLEKSGAHHYNALEIVVLEPGATYQVRAGQLVQWLAQHHRDDSVDVKTLKRRVQELLRLSSKR